MTRSFLSGLLALVSVGAIGAVPVACQSGGVGDPCTPEAEYDPQFAGFKVAQEFIESRSFQCATRICLVNHFQGRVSCPYGQNADPADTTPGANPLKPCNGPEDTSCGDPKTWTCAESQVYAPECTCKEGDKAGCDAACGVNGTSCDPKLGICTCTQSATITDVDYYCTNADPKCTSAACTRVLKAYLCHKKGDCQTSDPSDAKNENKKCCVPGTDTPVAVSVCGQCDSGSHRDADSAVYCSCRCCPEGQQCEAGFNYCSCPSGYACTEIRKFVGLGDPNLAGAYCVKEGSAYNPLTSECGKVKGYFNGDNCAGLAVPKVGN
jgi:hypothetical protein